MGNRRKLSLKIRDSLPMIIVGMIFGILSAGFIFILKTITSQQCLAGPTGDFTYGFLIVMSVIFGMIALALISAAISDIVSKY